MTLPFPIFTGESAPTKPAPSALVGLPLALPGAIDGPVHVAMEADLEDIHAQIMAALPKTAPKPTRKTVQKDSDPQYPYITQHCANGAHENSSVFTEKGTRLTPCRGEYVYRFVTINCTCWCHAMFATLKAEGSIALASVDAGTSRRETAVTVHPDGLEGDPATRPANHRDVPAKIKDSKWFGHPVYRNAVVGDGIESTLMKFVYRHVFDAGEPLKETILGRRKRGELEEQVELVCRLWLDGFLPVGDQLTVEWIAMMVNPDPEFQPSPGAVYSVLARWVRDGLAKGDVKPFRFVSFSEVVNDEGIAEIKRLRKREAEARAKGFF